LGRKRRDLNETERALWQQVAGSLRPLRASTSAAALGTGAEVPEPAALRGDPPADLPSSKPRVSAAARALLRGAASAEPKVRVDLAPDPHDALDRAHPHMDRRRFDTLRRGRMDPEARLDLHGMTAERAHGALTSFILSAHATGLRLVLVITGKGRPPEEDYFTHRHGILRHNVPHWLAAPPLGGRVLQVAPAHRKHGGGGAYYVYLRRQR
jgi:DNA-nicking Smr family endonuclease